MAGFGSIRQVQDGIVSRKCTGDSFTVEKMKEHKQTHKQKILLSYLRSCLAINYTANVLLINLGITVTYACQALSGSRLMIQNKRTMLV